VRRFTLITLMVLFVVILTAAILAGKIGVRRHSVPGPSVSPTPTVGAP